MTNLQYDKKGDVNCQNISWRKTKRFDIKESGVQKSLHINILGSILIAQLKYRHTLDYIGLLLRTFVYFMVLTHVNIWLKQAAYLVEVVISISDFLYKVFVKFFHVLSYRFQMDIINHLPLFLRIQVQKVIDLLDGLWFCFGVIVLWDYLFPLQILQDWFFESPVFQ